MKSFLQIPNVRYFVAFRIFFNSRFYYPVFTILFIDFGLTIGQFAILNAVWAATIVLAEVPSGALADIIGRRNLLIFAGFMMMMEIGVICIAPVGGENLFVLFFVNRILSGLAEASASGADEAIAYDSLKIEGDEKEWPQVLALQMKLQSACFVIAMVVGAFVYDPSAMSSFVRFLGSDIDFVQSVTLKFPVYLTFIMSVLAFYTTLRIKEVSDSNACIENETCSGGIIDAFRVTLNAGKWIWQTPLAIMLILCGLFFDHIIRMVITLQSQYFRVIRLPEATFGIIGGGISVLGIMIPSLAMALVRKKTMRYNFFLLSGLSFLGITGIAFFIPYWGIIPMVILFVSMMFNNFFLSQYLNEMTDSFQRATVLSFKGLAFNLAYGLIGFCYALLIDHIRYSGEFSIAPHQMIENEVFKRSISIFSWYYFGGLVVLIVAGMFKLRNNTMESGSKGSRGV